MGFKSVLKKVGGAAGKGAAEAGKVAVAGATHGIVQFHGDEIAAVLEKIDRIASALDGNIITRKQFKKQNKRLEAKIDALIAEVRALREIIKPDGSQDADPRGGHNG